MHVLVIGGCGFIGSHIVDELLGSGYSVSVFGRGGEKFRPPLAKVNYYLADTSSASTLQKLITRTDAVIHAASSTVPETSNSNPQHDVENNLGGMLQLLECMRQSNKRRIIFLSSGGTVYGRPDVLPIPEAHPLRPRCSYAIVKVAMEHYLNMYADLHGFHTTIIRPANPYGPRQGLSGKQGVIASFTAKAITHEELTLWGDGSEVRDFFHVRDLAILCKLAVESGKTGLFNAGSGEGHSIREIIDLLEDIHGSRLNTRKVENKAAGIPEVILDIQQAQEHFGWQPVIGLHDGMRNYYNWLKPIIRSNSIHRL